ncbi:MAG: metal-dependent hydrolase [Bacteroidota bacterium]|jgi:membrane-bound metal-dependent hydrolase YbcI (DUF457 family)
MPNGKTHLITGTLCGTVTSIVIQTKLDEREKIDLGHAFLSTGVGFASGRIPDIIEPPIHPNHRAFFHSFLFGTILGFGALKVWKVIKEKVSKRREQGQYLFTEKELVLGLLFIALIVVLLHLFMDGFTKKSLPII